MNEPWTIPPSWLLHSALGGGLLLLVAWGVMTRNGQPARRHFLGALGVTAALLAAVLCLGPRWFVLPVPLPFWHGQPAPPPVVAVEGTFDDPLTPETEFFLEEPAADPAPVTVAEPLGFRISFLLAALPPWLAAGWAAGAALLLGRWLLGYAVLAHLLRAARPAPPPVARLFAAMAGDVQPPRLLVSDRVRVPFSCGLLRPAVVLPPELCEADEPRLRWVFAHELTHLERRDAWTACLFGLAQAIYFYLPWFWWLRRQVRLCQEYIADAAAARQAGSAEDYAQFLLSLTTKPAVPLGATGVTGNTSDLFRRVSMLLQASNGVEKRCGWLWSLAATAGLVALAVFVSGVGLRAEAAAEDDKKPAVYVLEVEVVGDLDQNLDEKVIVITSDGKVKVIPSGTEDGSGKDKKKEGQPAVLPKVALPDVEDIIKKLPPGLSEEQIKQFREQMKKAQQDVQKAMEQLHQQLPKFQGDVQKHREAARKLVDELTKGEKNTRTEAARALSELARQTRVSVLNAPGQGRLGIRVEKPSDALAEQLNLPKGQGLVITEVTADSAAAKAGLKPNDILLSLDGKTVPNDADVLAGMVAALKADTAVDAVVLRKGKRETVKGINVGAAAGRRTRLQGLPGVGGVQPVPALPGQRRFQLQGGPADGKSVTITVNRTNDNFTATHQEGNVTVSVAGTVEGGKAKASSIEVKDGDKTSKFDSVDKVPEPHRDRVKKLLDNLEKGGGKIEIRTPAAPAAPVPPAKPTTTRPAVPATPAKPAVPATPPKLPPGRDILSLPAQNEDILLLGGLKLLEEKTLPVYEVLPKK